MTMTTIFAIAAMIIGIVVAAMSHSRIRAASRRPANGELKTLAKAKSYERDLRDVVRALAPGFQQPRHWP